MISLLEKVAFFRVTYIPEILCEVQNSNPVCLGNDVCLMGNINPNVFGDGSFADIENEVKKLYGCSSRKRLHPLDRMGNPASKLGRL